MIKRDSLSRPQWLLLLIAFLSAGALITLNYYSGRVISSIRAYIAAESFYSKGQKDASRQLAFFLVNQDEQYFELFKELIKTPLGDSIARVNLLKGGSIDTIRAGFIQAQNHPDDIELLIWVFQTFEKVPFMARAIQIWGEGDGLVSQLNELADRIQDDYQYALLTETPASNGLRKEQQLIWLSEIETLTNALTAKEREFTTHMGITARGIGSLLFLINILMVFLIIGSASAMWATLLFKVQKSKLDLTQKNLELQTTNSRLDHFIYASSHDLKAPISNLEGLLRHLDKNLIGSTNTMLLEKMDMSIGALKGTITAIEELIKTDRLGSGDAVEIQLEELIREVISENEMAIADANANIHCELHCKSVIYPRLALKSIFQNLLSNAVKYRSPQRDCEIRIESEQIGSRTILRIVDNGLGIDLDKNGNQIFGMFKRFHSHVQGSGLGLYAVKQVVQRNGGSIHVRSQPNAGTTFEVEL